MLPTLPLCSLESCLLLTPAGLPSEAGPPFLLTVFGLTLKVAILGAVHTHVCPISIFPISYKLQTH